MAAAQCLGPGFCKYLLKIPTAQAISGLVHTIMCIKDPIASLYGIPFISSMADKVAGQSSLDKGFSSLFIGEGA
jgi:hypothetical protein